MIAVFGDSWADPHHGHKGYPHMDALAWPNLLGEPVANYARAGSSLYYSYREFMLHHREYSQCVFVVTSIGRLACNQVTTLSGEVWHISNADTAQHFLRDRADDWAPETRQRIRAILDYYMWLLDYDVDTHAASLMLEQIRRVRPDCLIIPAVNHGRLLRGITNLSDWIEPTIRGLKHSWQAIEQARGIPYKEQRCCCHLTPEANASIALAVKQALAQGSWTRYPVPASIEHEHSMGYYWDLSQKTQAFAA
jgi:hypothetical protein